MTGAAGGLVGRGIVNTRALQQAPALNALLAAQGALPLAYPCITFAPPADCAALDAALAQWAAGQFDWLLLTSVNTVEALAARLVALGLRPPVDAARCGVVGPATARAARDWLGIEGATLPADHTAEALAEALPLALGARVLLPASALARPALADALLARGALVKTVVAYETTCARDGGVDLPALLAAGRVDALTFTSSSTVTCCVQRFVAQGGNMDALCALPAACLGQPTAATARAQGFAQVITPGAQTLAALVEALAAALA